MTHLRICFGRGESGYVEAKKQWLRFLHVCSLSDLCFSTMAWRSGGDPNISVGAVSPRIALHLIFLNLGGFARCACLSLTMLGGMCAKMTIKKVLRQVQWFTVDSSTTQVIVVS